MVKSQFNSFFIDMKNIIVDTFDDIHQFLNHYVNDTVLGIVGIAIIAIIAVRVFVNFNNR